MARQMHHEGRGENDEGSGFLYGYGEADTRGIESNVVVGVGERSRCA